MADRPTDGLLQPDLVGDELGLVLKRQWQQPVSSWGKDKSGSNQPLETITRIRVKEGQDADCHNRARVAADPRQALSFPVVTSVVKQPQFLVQQNGTITDDAQ